MQAVPESCRACKAVGETGDHRVCMAGEKYPCGCGCELSTKHYLILKQVAR